MTDRILIIGGYGVFGGRLAIRLIADNRFDVIIAGRSLNKAQHFCETNGGRALELDLSADDLASKIQAQSPAVVIDAAGPFQAYGQREYAVVKAAIQCGAHYLDFSDDAAFTAGISELDVQAKAAQVSVLSGASTVPAISSAVIDELSKDISDLHLIETAILPGNRAPRGTSVIRAILAQVGQPIRMWRGGRWTTFRGWSHARPIRLSVDGVQSLRPRRASFIGAPDLELFPSRYRARSVLFRAGLELSLMQRGLSLLSDLVRIGLMRSLIPMTRLLTWLAVRLERFGADTGGMQVRVVGLDTSGHGVERIWTLIAQGGDGPHIPAIPGWIMVYKLIDGEVEHGARACVGAFDLRELDRELAPFKIVTEQVQRPVETVFEEALGTSFKALPAQLRDLHTLYDQRVWRGEASITRGKGLLSKLVGAMVGFPKAAAAIPVEVEMTKTARGETWNRRFGDKQFRSYLSRPKHASHGVIRERFGLLSFEIALQIHAGQIEYPLKRASCLGVPLPRFLVPKSETAEFVDEHGRACFDVSVSLPIAGQIAHYRGWLMPG